MAYDRSELFKKLRALRAEQRAAGEEPTKSRFCELAVDRGYVRSDGTAHGYVTAMLEEEKTRGATEGQTEGAPAATLSAELAQRYQDFDEFIGQLRAQTAIDLQKATEQTGAAFSEVIAAQAAVKDAELNAANQLIDELEDRCGIQSTELSAMIVQRATSAEELATTGLKLKDTLGKVTELEGDLRLAWTKVEQFTVRLTSGDALIAMLESDKQAQREDLLIAQREIDGLKSEVQRLSRERNDLQPLQDRLIQAESERDAQAKTLVAELTRNQRLQDQLAALVTTVAPGRTARRSQRSVGG